MIICSVFIAGSSAIEFVHPFSVLPPVAFKFLIFDKLVHE